MVHVEKELVSSGYKPGDTVLCLSSNHTVLILPFLVSIPYGIKYIQAEASLR